VRTLAEPRHREGAAEVDPREELERTRVGDLMDAAADQQVAGERPGGGVVHGLVDLQLAVARAALQEVVVREQLDEIAEENT
jgi:hypothetical protein